MPGTVRFDKYNMSPSQMMDFQHLVNKIEDSVKETFTVETPIRSLNVENISVDWPGNRLDLKEQLKAKESNQDFTIPIRAEFVITDSDGLELERSKKLVGRIPRPTGRGTYIIGGQEYNINYQLRLKPGIYITHNQEQIQAFINTATRQNIKLFFDPDSSKFTLNIGNRKFSLSNVLNGLGIKFKNMETRWGKQIAKANAVSDVKAQKEIEKLYNTMYAFNKEDKDYGAQREDVLQALKETELDPWTTKVTLGEAVEGLDPKVLFDTTKLMLQVSSGARESDNRDALYFKRPFGIDDMVKFSMDKQRARIQKKIKDRLTDPNKTMPSVISRPLSVFNKSIRDKFIVDELARNEDQISPLEVLSNMSSVTLMGEGGIPSTHAITNKTREVNDTYLNFIDPLQTPSGPKTGVNLNLSYGTVKAGSKLKALFVDKNGDKHQLSPEDCYDKYIALPEQHERKEGKYISKSGIVYALYKGKIEEVPASKVNYIIPFTSHTLSNVSNILPMINHNASIRSKYAIQQTAAALPLKHREVPLVRVKLKGTTGEALVNTQLSTQVPADVPPGSIIKQVRSDKIIITGPKGEDYAVEIYKDFPLNSHIAMNSTPVVKTGDKINPGDILAETNTSKDGSLAMGVNLRTAYLPYKGLNYMDGLVITESAAKKLTSEHMHQEEHSQTRDDVISKNKFMAHYPGLFTKSQFEKLDDDGIVWVGQTVEPGDPILTKMSRRKLTEDDILRGNISSIFKQPLKKDIKTWDHDNPGVIHKIVHGKDFVKIYIKTEEPAKIGDKISGRSGQKGVITTILEDSMAPKDAYGRPVDLLQNPAAVPSRMNVAQIFETALGKLAAKTGKPYDVDPFAALTAQTIMGKLKKAGVNSEEKLFDPDGSELGKILIGPQYFLKMKQQSEKKFKARGRTDPYELTSRRPHKGPKLDILGIYAMLAHGVPNLMREMATSKSELNDDYWRKIELGYMPSPPKKTFALSQLEGMLKASGINVIEEADDFRLAPLTDADIDSLGAKEVLNPGKAVRIGDPRSTSFLTPEDGGLYDRKVFGGLDGDRWGKIKLHDKYPNPLFEDAVRSIAHFNQKQYAELISGDLGLKNGKLVPGETADYVGGTAWEKILGSIDVDKRISTVLKELPSKRGTNKDKMIKELKYLRGLQDLKMKPTDYMLSQFPVLPPKFRPVYLTKDGRLRTSDLTDLYRDFGLANQSLSDVRDMPQSMTTNLRKDMYAYLSALQGITTSPNPSRKMSKGLLAYLKGTSPPTGFFQNKLLSKRQALGGQAVIMPDPTLDIDTVRLPDAMAWKIMEPFIMRRIVKSGTPPLRAKKLIEDHAEVASKALDLELKERPVILSRDPKLHKYNYLGFMAERHPGKAIYIPPLVVKGFNADFDGDTMSVNVPISPSAVRDVKNRMMPSQNALKYGVDTIMIAPEEDVIAGLYRGTMMGRKGSAQFNSPAEAMEAYKKGSIKLTEGILLEDTWTTPGRIILNHKLPEQYRDYEKTWGDKEMREVLNDVYRKTPNEYTDVVQNFKSVGENFGYKTGMSFSLMDFAIPEKREALSVIKNMKAPPKNYSRMVEGVEKKLRTHLSPTSALRIMADSGAKGGWGNIRQMLYSPMFFTDSEGKPYPHAIQSGYAEGMDFRDFWTGAKAGRVSEMRKSLETADPGYFGKQVMRSGLGQVIQPGDKNLGEGIEYDVTLPTVVNRYLASDLVNKRGDVLAKANSLITPEIVNAAQSSGIKKINVRSPLTTDAERGLYAKDFGRLPEGHKPHTGTDIGMVSGHTITEPSIQLVLKAFHSGGATGAGKTIGLYELWPLLNGRAPSGKEAIMAPKAGTISEINKLKSGAHEVVFASGEKLITTPNLALNIKIGDKVKKGQALQDGFFDPRKLLEYKGLRTLQNYLVDEIEDTYGKNAPDRRYIEAIVGGMTRYAKVKNPGASSEYNFGDVAPISKFKNINRGLDDNESPIDYEPVFYGMDQQLSKTSEDWIHKMLGGDMIRQLRLSAATGAKSPKHGTVPVMPFMYGIDFGQRLAERGEY